MTRSTPTEPTPTGGSLSEVLVHRIDETHVIVVPPEPEDPQSVIDVKMFLMACLHRRNLDSDFEDEMKNWLRSYSKEEFRQAVQGSSTPVKRH